MGLERPQAGSICCLGEVCRSEAEFQAIRGRIGLLFQDSDDQLFCPTVLDDVAFGPLNLGQAPAQALASALATLTALGLADFAERVTHRLSAGEKRLVALATVLAMAPTVLLLDEPTNGLVEITRARLIAHLASLHQAMLIVSHDHGFLARLAHRTLRLRAGRLRAGSLTDQVRQQP